MHEAQRLGMLRAADHGGLEAPAGLADLFIGTELLPWKMSEALARWRTLYGLAASGDAGAETMVTRLSLALAQHFTAEADPLRARGLLEGALDVTRASYLRQSLLAAMSRCAAEAGDLAAAEAWLAQCDPTPVSLMMDTEYRYARAFLDTMAGQPDRVLRVLGAAPEEVPLDNANEAACVALRANALERSGHGDRALANLDHFNSHYGAFQRHLLRQFLRRNAKLRLCEGSMPEVQRRQAKRDLAAASKVTGLSKVAVVVTFATGIITVVVAVYWTLFQSVGGGHYAVGLGGLMTSVFTAINYFDWRKTRAARSTITEGDAYVAQVVHARGTNRWTNGVPQLLFRVLAVPSDGMPFYAHSMFHADHLLRARFGPGTVVVVRVGKAGRGDAQFELT